MPDLLWSLNCGLVTLVLIGVGLAFCHSLLLLTALESAILIWCFRHLHPRFHQDSLSDHRGLLSRKMWSLDYGLFVTHYCYLQLWWQKVLIWCFLILPGNHYSTWASFKTDTLLTRSSIFCHSNAILCDGRRFWFGCSSSSWISLFRFLLDDLFSRIS